MARRRKAIKPKTKISGNGERSERIWIEMTSDSEAEDDIWSEMENSLLLKPHERNQKLRRWKYFGK